MSETIYHIIARCMPGLGKELLTELSDFGVAKTLETNDFVIKQGQFVRYLPIVLEGTIRVFSEEQDVQFLLYYIYPGATCVFSFAQLSGKKQIDFSGIAEEKTQLLLIPIDKVRNWIVKYPAFNELIINEYQKRYDDLLQMTKQIICYNLENRLLNYLKTKKEMTQSALLHTSHRLIANDLGTSREVISRLLKKLEKDGKLLQTGRQINLFSF